MERIDKIISKELNIGRNDAKSLIKSGKVFLNGNSVKSPSEKLDEETDVLTVGGRVIHFRRFVYIMMNKPEGVISSTDGRKTSEKTVIDILPEDMKRKNLFPAGRLDKNTTGFVLITDDGEFAHRILSPRNHIPKTYIAKLDKPFNDEISDAFANGITIGDDECLPAVLEPVNGDYTLARVIIKQGMYHQIKRMFKKYSIEVIGLKRIKMGRLNLDERLAAGECRYIDEKELEMINSD
ncbi:MAG: rRNA pseudouridine synthase [Eubacterium sp.]|nr:rRNA pseudouridine synthase [Eubacterium sp.]